jgi:hypothetical protein
VLSADEVGAPKSESPQTVVRCVICCEQLQPGAKLCTRCNRYQDWRRFFGISSTVLTLLVALFAVLSSAVPVVVSLFTPARSDVYWSLLEWKESKVKLLVANRGLRPAVAKNLELVPNTVPPTSFRPDQPDLILEPTKYHILTFTCVVNDVRNPLPALGEIKPKSALYLVIFPFASEPSEIKRDAASRFGRGGNSNPRSGF